MKFIQLPHPRFNYMKLVQDSKYVQKFLKKREKESRLFLRSLPEKDFFTYEHYFGISE